MEKRLNLVMTYPVWWGLSHIMEDYIQNFYDVLGAENFSRNFIYCYNEDKKELRMEGKKGFHVEWLQYIGVSTKRDNSIHYMAGKFGEGFKIASLCAYRDHELSIHMESQDWALDVIKIPGEINGQNIEFFGYDIKERAYEDNAVLTLGNVELKAYQIFTAAVQHFFYPENPVFGKCLVSTKDYAIYKINASAISDKSRITGRVFASMQERAKIEGIPLIFCNHRYEPDLEDDRDRDRFRSHDIEAAVADIVSRLDGEVLGEVFIAFQPYWCKKRNKTGSGPDWSRLIRKMIGKICSDDSLRQSMHEYLKDSYIADTDPYVIKQDKNKYRTAQSWFYASKFYGTNKLLPYYFADLGIHTLYGLCERYEGFHIIHKPDKLQQRRIKILEKMAQNIFSDILCYETLPECKVIVNKGTPNEGFAKTINANILIRNRIGLKVVNDIKEINLRKQLLDKSAFSKAMVVYMHELLHQFGGDASRQFRAAILAMNYRIMEKSTMLEEYEKEWKNVNK